MDPALPEGRQRRSSSSRRKPTPPSAGCQEDLLFQDSHGFQTGRLIDHRHYCARQVLCCVVWVILVQLSVAVGCFNMGRALPSHEAAHLTAMTTVSAKSGYQVLLGDTPWRRAHRWVLRQALIFRSSAVVVLERCVVKDPLRLCTSHS